MMKFKKVFFFSLTCFVGVAWGHYISFIIPCYNCSKTVEESIDSIYKQNLQSPFEVICTDDGSTDATLEVLKRCQKKYHSLHIYIHEHNKGGGAARNTCVRHSKGDLIFCLDSDNVLCPNSVGGLVELIGQTGCDVASFAYGKAFRNNFVFVRNFDFWVPGHRYDLYTWINHFENNPGTGGNYLFTRKSYDRAGGYPEDVGASDTHGFGIAQMVTGSVMRTIPNTFYWHRLHEHSYYMREERKNANSANHARVLKKFSEIFSEESQKILQKKNLDEVWADFYHKKRFALAPKPLIECLFKAYEYRYQKKYAEAAQEFLHAIELGCTSEKIRLYAHEMQALC